MDIITLIRDTGIFGIAAWFIQLQLSKSADRKFEVYKTELDHKTREFQAILDSKMELYRAELNLQNYKSTKIYEQQLSTIIELHKKLTKLNDAMQIMTAFMKPIIENAKQEENDRVKNASEAYNDFIAFYKDNLIFIPKNTVDKLNVVRDDYWQSYHDYTFRHRIGMNDSFTFEKSKEASERVSKKTQPAVEQLIIDFRALIGVENLD